ncbi:MAG: hypothetical protein L6V87_09415 [Ruminococcus sp.]|nr:MAG: hypothetical protein L6V87_09415 [Ruminococcus sp.]
MIADILFALSGMIAAIPVYVSTANDKCISGMDGVVAVAAGGSFVIENGIADTKTTTVFLEATDRLR